MIPGPTQSLPSQEVIFSLNTSAASLVCLFCNARALCSHVFPLCHRRQYCVYMCLPNTLAGMRTALILRLGAAWWYVCRYVYLRSWTKQIRLLRSGTWPLATKGHRCSIYDSRTPGVWKVLLRVVWPTWRISQGCRSCRAPMQVVLSLIADAYDFKVFERRQNILQ